MFAMLTFNVKKTFTNLFTAPFEVPILLRALDVSTQEAAVLFIDFMETNAICKKCTSPYVAPPSHFKCSSFVCQKCTREYGKKYRHKRKLEGNPVIPTKPPEGYMQEYKKRFKEKHGAPMSTLRYRNVNKHNLFYKFKTNVRVSTYSKVKAGKIIKLPCAVCGDEKVEIHHVDYSKPDHVIWLCPQHHKEWHKIHNKLKYNIINILIDNHIQ